MQTETTMWAVQKNCIGHGRIKILWTTNQLKKWWMNFQTLICFLKKSTKISNVSADLASIQVTLNEYDSLRGIKQTQRVNFEWKHLCIFLLGSQGLFCRVKSCRATLGCQLKQVYPNPAKGRWINSAWGLEKCSKLPFPSNKNLRLMYSLLKVMQTNLKNTDRALCNGSTWRENSPANEGEGQSIQWMALKISQRRAGRASTKWDGGQRRDHQGDGKITGCVGGII